MKTKAYSSTTRRQRQSNRKSVLSYNVSFKLLFHLRQTKKSCSSSMSSILFLCLSPSVSVSDWVLQRAFHGEKEGGNKRKGGSKRE